MGKSHISHLLASALIHDGRNLNTAHIDPKGVYTVTHFGILRQISFSVIYTVSNIYWIYKGWLDLCDEMCNWHECLSLGNKIVCLNGVLYPVYPDR